MSRADPAVSPGRLARLQLALGRRIAPPRFAIFLLLLPLATLAHHTLLRPAEWMQSLGPGFDVAAIVFLVSLAPFLTERDPAAIRRHARDNDANRVLILAVTSLLTVVIMTAIAGELPQIHRGSTLAVIQLVVTLALIWLFANSVYALHYAHDFYTSHPGHSGDCGGLEFPGTPEPAYAEFFYFAFTLGMTFQTSDVAITATRLRGIALLHSIAAFVFNIGVIAFTINAIGGASG